MGLTAYLELYSSDDFDPAEGSTILFAIKNHLPFGWFLFFDATDFRSRSSKRDGSTYTILQKDKQAAIARASQRLAALGAALEEDLAAVLQGFVRSVEASRGSVLVLNSHRLEAPREALVVPLAFLDAIATLGPDEICGRGAELFGEGVTFAVEAEEEEGRAVLFLDEKGAVTGWPEDAAEPGWFDDAADEAPPKAPSSTAEEAIARVWADPDSPVVRRVCADELLTLGDPRGEILALLTGDVEFTERQQRKLERLIAAHRASLEGPFAGLRTALEGGFPASVTLPRTPGKELLEHPAWATVHTVELSGGPEVLLHPNLARLRRVVVRSADVVALARLGQRLPFKSIALVDEHTPEIFASLTSRTVFPELVELWVKSFGVWLPPAAEPLLAARPELVVRGAAHAPHGDPRALEPLTPEQQTQRRARWSAPAQGAQLAGKRFDNA
jgi:hypothetical protein